MVLLYNEICLSFFTGRWAYNKEGIGGEEEEEWGGGLLRYSLLLCNFFSI